MKKIIIKVFAFLMASTMILSGCSNSNVETENLNNATTENLNLQNDISLSIGNSNETVITLNGDTAQCDNSNVVIEDSVITIKSAGVYALTGTLNDGQIIVDCSKEEKVELILNNVDIGCSTSSPIYVVSADKTIINLENGSINNVSDNRAVKDDTIDDTDIPGSAIYSKDDLTIKGSGSLNVTGTYNNGIVTKNDLKITSGNITVNATNNAIKGNDSVTIKNGVLNLTCNGDGIKTDNIEETDKGYIYIENGDFTINSQGDCLKSDTYTTILDGNFNLTSADGYTNASAHNSDMDFGGHNGKNFEFNQNEEYSQDGSMPNREDFKNRDMQSPQDGSMPNREDFKNQDMQLPQDGSMPNREDFNSNDANTYNDIQTQSNNTDTTTEVNSKTISSNGDLTIENGTFNLNSQDDSLHSNANIIINDGTFIINAGGKGIHSDYDCNINGGNIDIQNSYEGIEGTNIYVNDGTINIIASDDGFNASDHTETSTSNNGFNASSNAYLEFNGGYTYVNASGDGIDSNGDMVFNGGTVIVEGPTNGGNGPLDCGDNQNTITINGGQLTIGGSNQMFEIPDSSSTQNIIYCLELSAENNNHIILVDEDNNIIDSIENTKAMESIIFSSSSIEIGKTYHIYKDVTLSDTEIKNNSLDESSFSEDGTFLNGTEVGSVEITGIINQIGDGTVSGFGNNGKNRHESFNIEQ